MDKIRIKGKIVDGVINLKLKHLGGDNIKLDDFEKSEATIELSWQELAEQFSQCQHCYCGICCMCGHRTLRKSNNPLI